MSRKSLFAIVFVLFALFAATFAFNNPLAHAQNTPIKPVKSGELQLSISTDEGVIPAYWVYQFYKDKELVIDGSKNTDGGLLRFPNLKPGEYELFIKSNGNSLSDHAPVRVLGLIIPAGKAVRLSIILHKGTMVETIGKPVVDIPSAIIVSEELEKLHKEIDELKKVIEELKKK